MTTDSITYYPKIVNCGMSVAKLTQAHKVHECINCHGVIVPGERYYQMHLREGDALVARFPEKVHAWCLYERYRKTEN